MSQLKVLIVILVCTLHTLNSFGQGWSKRGKMTCDPCLGFSGQSANGFGQSVAIDGNYAIANSYDTIFVYTRQNDSWSYHASLYLSDGSPIGFVGIRDSLIVGLMGNKIYLFQGSGSGWNSSTETNTLTISKGDNGVDIDISESGTEILVGCPNADTSRGVAYLFEKGVTDWIDTTETAVFKPTIRDSSGLFGNAVSFIDSTALVASLYSDKKGVDKGIVYAFRKPIGGWKDTTESFYLCSSDTIKFFGSGMDASNNTIVVGAKNSLYVFEKDSSGQLDSLETAVLKVNDPSNINVVGQSIAIGEHNIFAGDWGNDDLGIDTGVVYVFQEPDSGWMDSFEDYKIYPSHLDSVGRFGYVLDASSCNVVVGSLADFIQESNSVLIYDARSLDTLIQEVCNSFISPSGNVLITSGTYHDTLMNSFRCDSIITIQLTINDDTLVTLDTTIEDGTSVQFGGLNLSTPGSYYDTLQNVLGCDSVLQLNLSISSGLGSGIEYDFKLFPNPTNEKFSIRFASNVKTENLSCEVYNLFGKLVQESISFNRDNSKTISVGGYPSGLYYVCVKREDEIIVRLPLLVY